MIGGGNCVNGQNSNGISDINNVSNKTYINSIELNNGSGITSPNKNDKPVQKVIPSRNTTPIKYQQTNNSATTANWSTNNGNQPIGEVTAIITKDTSTYVKPNCPMAAPANAPLSYNSVPSIDKTAKVTNKNGAKANR